MRMSLDKNDRAYSKDSPAINLHVYLDGERVPYAISADEEEGWVIFYRTDVMLPNGLPERIKQHGFVRILVAPWAGGPPAVKSFDETLKAEIEEESAE